MIKDTSKNSILRRFAYVAHGLAKRNRKDDIQILIATDCISEGQNLQDATLLVNYDLTWTPLKLIQRIGRLDRPTPHNRTFGVWNFFPGEDYFERAIGIRQRLVRRSGDYQKMAGIDVISDNIRNLDKLTDEDLEHVRRIYSSGEIDFDSVLDSIMPATEYLRRLAKATDEQIDRAKKLPTGTVAVYKKSNVEEGIVTLVKDSEGQSFIVWKEKNGSIKSRFNGISQEAILSKIDADIGTQGHNLPKWFDEEQKELLETFAEDMQCLIDDLCPVITIAISNQ